MQAHNDSGSCSTSPFLQLDNVFLAGSVVSLESLPSEIVTHILSFLELKLDWILRDHDARNVVAMRNTIMHIMYGYRREDKSRQLFLVFPSISAPVDVRIAKLWPTITLRFESFKEMCSRVNTEWWRMDFVFHQNLHRLYFRDVKLSFDVMRGNLSGLRHLYIVDCWIDDRGLANLLRYAANLQRLHLVNNPDLSATAVSNEIAKHRALIELRFNPFYSRRDSILLDKLFACKTLQTVDLVNSVIGRCKGESFETCQVSTFYSSGRLEFPEDLIYFEKLKNLYLLQLDVENIPTNILIRLVEQLPRLRDFYCYMGERENRSTLLEAIAKTPRITSITLEKTTRATQWLHYLRNLQLIYVDYNFNDDDMYTLLKHNKTILHLQMVKQYTKASNLTFASFHYLGIMNDSLISLKLQNVKEDLTYSFKALAKHPSLRKLSLANCNLNSERVVDLLHIKTLEALKIDDVFEYDDSVDLFLRQHPRLTCFKIPQSSISMHLFIRLFQKPNLRKLHLPMLPNYEMHNIPKNDTLQELYIGLGPVEGNLLSTLKEKCTALRMSPWFAFRTRHHHE